MHLQGDDALLRDIRALSGTAPHALDDEDIVGLFLSSLRADYRAIGTYRAPEDAVLGCPVVALTGDTGPKTTVEEAQDWRDHTTGPFALKVFSGTLFEGSTASGSATFSLVIAAFSMIGSYTERFTVPTSVLRQ
ncbi:thioesterase II family protein [Streptomyces olivaceus]|uniref:thioesterase II family protein n=1 Tax=Streptomyces olivaceus TaxID=47716 RepID=UPI0033AEB829